MTLAVQCISEADEMAKQREVRFEGGEISEREKAEYLQSLKEELNKRSRGLKHHLFEIGKLLCEVKKHLPHGEFKPWIEANFDQAYETANNCMKVYKSCMATPDVVEYFNPSSLYIMCKPNFPECYEVVKSPFSSCLKIERAKRRLDPHSCSTVTGKQKGGVCSGTDLPARWTEEIMRIVDTNR